MWNKKILPTIDGWNESLYIELSSVVELATRAKILSYHTILNVYPKCQFFVAKDTGQ